MIFSYSKPLGYDCLMFLSSFFFLLLLDLRSEKRLDEQIEPIKKGNIF
jgi:hypothetical protein